MSGGRAPTRRVTRFRWTRREVLRALQLGALGAGTVGLAVAGRESLAERRATGVCRLCTMHCGIEVTIRNERLVRVEGNPASKTRGFICHHGRALREVVHADERVKLPLLRKGDAFREVSWSDALGFIAQKLEAVKRAHGPQALAVVTGWPFVRHPLVRLLQRFTRAFGSPNLATVASLCEASLRIGKALVVGSNFWPDMRRAKTLFVWGANPTFTSPPFAHLVAGFATKPRNLVVVDPCRTELARAANLHLQVRPGTDGALALGMVRVVLEEQLYDRTFVEEHVTGLEALRAAAREWTPERVEEVTSVPRADLVRAVKLLAAEGPGVVWDGLGVEHHEGGVATVQALASLQALLGYVDVPGGASLHKKPEAPFWGELLPQLYDLHTAEPVPPEPTVLAIGDAEHPVYAVYNRQAQAMLFTRAMLEDQPYPLRALISVGCNPALTWPGAGRVQQGFDKLDLLVSVDPFLTRTGELADVVLPASTFIEAPTVEGSGLRVEADDERVARSPLLLAQHQSWPDWKIIFELAKAVGLGRYFPWDSFDAALEAKGARWMKDDRLQVRADPPPAPGAPVPRFPTPSGKVELDSSVLRRFGLPGVPSWSPPTEAPDAEYPLLLVTGPRTRPYINSQFRQVPSIAQHQREPVAELHPSRAQALGLSDGDRVAVVSRRGRVELRLSVTDRVHPDSLVVANGWTQANANLLTDETRRDPVAGFPAFRSLACRVEKAGVG